MAINDISLTQGMRKNLLDLQKTSKLLDRTQTRLSTGKKVNTAIDNPTNFFAAKNHVDRASDLSTRKDGMSEGIQTVKAADNGISALTALIENARGILQSARSAASDADTVDALATQFNEVLSQMDTIVQDSGYRGINLLNDGEMVIQFDETGDSVLTVSGFAATIGAGGLDIAAATTSAGAWTVGGTGFDTTADELDVALSTLRTESEKLASGLNIITIRQDFTDNMISTLQEGADKLTLADTNEEGANMLMLQTRQQLGITALSLSSQAAQSVLGLF